MFGPLDFIYMPSRDTAADAQHFTEALGGELVFAIERFGARVAMVRFGEESPALGRAAPLHGAGPVLVFRVDDLAAAVEEGGRRGATAGVRTGFPYGPIQLVELPGPQRIALYERTRPEMDDALAGRRDF